jgi:ribosomal protein S13
MAEDSPETLHAALTEIRGVGPATAEEIEQALAEHELKEESETGQDDSAGAAVDEARDQLGTALEYFASDRPRHAEQHVQRAHETLDELEG